MWSHLHVESQNKQANGYREQVGGWHRHGRVGGKQKERGQNVQNYHYKISEH